MRKQISFFTWFRKYLRRQFKELRQRYEIEMAHPTVEFEYGVKIINSRCLHMGENIHIAKNVLLDCGIGQWCGGGGSITLGNGVWIAPDAILLGAGGIEVHDHAKIGTSVMVSSITPDTTRLLTDRELMKDPIVPHILGKIVIQEDVMIGPNCIVFPGVTIGSRAIIAPGCMLRHDVPPNTFTFPNTRFLKKKHRMQYRQQPDEE